MNQYVDRFVFDSYGEHEYARWVLCHMIIEEPLRTTFAPFVAHQQLWCVYEGERVQVVGANHERMVLANGRHVSVTEVSNFEAVVTNHEPFKSMEVQSKPQCKAEPGTADFIHVDEWIHDASGDPYARWFFNNYRWAAALKMDWSEFMTPYKLFGTYQGERYRVTGCSQMGDVWLHANFNVDTGYQKRVNLNDVSNWSPSP